MADKGQKRLSESPLLKKINDFKEFETSLRGFLECAALVKFAKGRNKDVDKLLTDLGLDGLRSITFHSGFDGPTSRTVAEIDMPGPRKGLLKLAAGKPFTLADVPPIPDDATSWSMTNFDIAGLYDIAVPAAEQIVRILAPDEAKQLPDALKAVDDALGISLRKDLLGSLGDRFATYTSPGEGILTLGQTYLFQVKDEKKLLESIDAALKGLSKAAGIDIVTKKKMYRGVELREVDVKQPGFIFLPTYTIHKGWLVLSYFPQPVQGYILRATGELPTWKPDAADRGDPGEDAQAIHVDLGFRSAAGAARHLLAGAAGCAAFSRPFNRAASRSFRSMSVRCPMRMRRRAICSPMCR